MTHAWFDVTAGVSGDMVLGALVDAGADLAAIQAAVDAVAPGSVLLRAASTTRAGQRSTKVSVEVLVDDPPHRRWATLRGELAASGLAEPTCQLATAVFARLAEAEARVHGTSADDVHFHEVGALDSIADVVGACEALRLLGVTTVSASAIALGAGRVRAAHGDLPVPVPAVAELMVGWSSIAASGPSDRAVATHGSHDQHSHEHPHQHGHRQGHDHPAEVLTSGDVGELATPTGVALVRAWASACEGLPALTVAAVGVGAGSRDLPGRPNVVRVILGEHSGVRTAGTLIEQRANVDDLDPRLWPGVVQACLDAGAVDAWLVPIVMKKGRPAHTLHTLVSPDASAAVADVILRGTTTLGVRSTPVERRVLDRSFVTLDVLGHPLLVKVGHLEGRIVHAAAEFESLAALATTLGRPEVEIAQRAAAAIVAAGLVTGAEVPHRD